MVSAGYFFILSVELSSLAKSEVLLANDLLREKICQKSKLCSGREAFHETHLNEGALVLLFFTFCRGLCEFLNHVNLTMLCLDQP